MTRAKDRELVNRLLKNPRTRRVNTRAALIKVLVEEKNWRLIRAEHAVDAALADESIRLKVGRGGSLKYSGTDASIYAQVASCLESWSPKKAWRNPLPIDCHSAKGARGHGDWVYPDLVVLADPVRRTTAVDRLEIHAVEVEHVGGFSIKSVYQAFEQGRGANYSWVMFLASDEDAAEWKAHVGPNRPEVPLGSSSSLAAKQRVYRAATERGVGLVVMRDAHARTSWHEIVAPQRKRTSDIPDDDLHLLTKASGLTIERLHDRSLQAPRKR